MKQIRIFLLIAALMLPLCVGAYAQADDGAVVIDTAEVGDTQMAYCRFGTGEKDMVILPGVSVTPVTASGELIAQSFAQFADEYTVWLFDVPDVLPEDCTVDALADETAAVMQSLGIEHACIFGASMGGMMAQCIAAEYPELAGRLVLGSTEAYCCDVMNERVSEWLALAQAGSGEELAMTMARDIYTPEIVEANLEAFEAQGQAYTDEQLQRLAVLANALIQFDIRERLDNITCPVLVLACEGDEIMPCDVQRQLAEAVDAEYYCYGPEYSHAVYDEAEDYHDRMYDFFTRNPSE